MIFSGGLCEKVLDGSKTQTRRPIKFGRNALGDPVELPCPYKVGQTIAVQPGRGKHAVGRIRVLAVDRVPVGSISVSDAHAEGFQTTWGFRDRWREFYGTVDGDCWRIEFEIAEGGTA